MLDPRRDDGLGVAMHEAVALQRAQELGGSISLTPSLWRSSLQRCGPSASATETSISPLLVTWSSTTRLDRRLRRPRPGRRPDIVHGSVKASGADLAAYLHVRATPRCVLTWKQARSGAWPGDPAPLLAGPDRAGTSKALTMTIVVTGATGHLGRLVVEDLLTRGVPAGEIVAAGRRAERLAGPRRPRRPDRRRRLHRPRDPRRRLRGGRRVLLVSGSEVGHRVAQHTAVVQAAATPASACSPTRASPTPIPTACSWPPSTARPSRSSGESGVPFTFLRNSWYLENYLPQLPTYLEHGVVGRPGTADQRRDPRRLRGCRGRRPPRPPPPRARSYELGGARPSRSPSSPPPWPTPPGRRSSTARCAPSS